MIKNFNLIIALVILLAVGFSGFFTVNETQRAIVLRLGKIQTLENGKEEIVKPGLNFKIPFITSAVKFDVRLQTLDIDSSRMVTLEKKDVFVDYYVKWRVRDIPTFYKATGGNIRRIQTLIKQKANDGIRAEFGKRTIKEVVSGDRKDIMEFLKNYVDGSVSDLGVDVIDVRIKRIDLPNEVSSTVFERMRSERHRVATKHRAQGHATAEAIMAKADAKATIIEANAKKENQVIRAQADAKAANLYAQAYSKEPKFYKVYRNLLAYIKTLKNKGDVLVLSANSEFFKNLNLQN
jgi:membrane protease subunit HflC